MGKLWSNIARVCKRFVLGVFVLPNLLVRSLTWLILGGPEARETLARLRSALDRAVAATLA